MDRQQVLLAKTLEAAGISLSIDTFNDRLILQKAVYLLQAAGLHLGYRYRWYLRGPYCTSVADHAFGIAREGQRARKELDTWRFQETSAEKARKLRPLLRHQGETPDQQAKRLELLASILFLLKTRQVRSADAARVSEFLRQNGKDFSEQQVKEAIEELKQYGLAC